LQEDVVSPRQTHAYADEPASSFESWVTQLSQEQGLTAKGRAVLTVLRMQPELSAYASSRVLAAHAGVNIGTITRTAQALGFSGWSALQHEFRSRYVASLSAVQVATEHDREGSNALASIARDRAALDYLERSIPAEAITAAARRIHEARRIVVLAQGSIASVGIALAHNLAIAGHDAHHVADPAILANTLAHLETGDLLVAVNCWQIYSSTLEALQVADSNGVGSVVITDSGTPLLGNSDTLQIAVPSEGVGFFPSLVAALSVAQAIVVELSTIDPAATREALTRAEQQWDNFGLLRHRPH
jgi:DNA-binding MurR/RpiR family transcriptional regulator